MFESVLFSSKAKDVTVGKHSRVLRTEDSIQILEDLVRLR